MIQRPQTALLFLSAILYAVMALAPIWSISIGVTSVTLSACKAVLTNDLDGVNIIAKESSNIYLLVCLVCGAILSLVSIFFFKNRPLQAKLSALNSLLITTFVGLTIFLAIPKAQSLIMTKDVGQYHWGFYLSLVVIVSNFIANKLIRKDEALVKSVDRIR